MSRLHSSSFRRLAWSSVSRGLVFLSVAAAPVHAAVGAPSCDEPGWHATFGAAPGVSGAVHAIAVFDDGSGSGPALYVGGLFSHAGGVAVNNIARWDGASWTALGTGVSDTVQALAVFDDGSGAGPALYAGGKFITAGGVTVNRIARWNGTSWSALDSGMNNEVRALTVFDDSSGRGPGLYAGGAFVSASGELVNNIAKWDGKSWSPLGQGMTDAVNALTVFDDGSGRGPALYAGGHFTQAGTSLAHRVARWDGAAWSHLAVGVNNVVHALTVFDDGSGAGPALYACGQFTEAASTPANFIARWSGTSWSALGNGLNSTALSMTVFDDGAGGGPALYAGGWFTFAGTTAASSIARWSAGAWSALGAGVNGPVQAMTTFDDGSGDGPALYTGGSHTTAGGLNARNVARFDAGAWSALGDDVGVSNAITALTVFDSGSPGGAVLYAGGLFTTAGGETVNRVVAWDGDSWSALGAGMSSTVNAVAMFDDGLGGGPALFAGGFFLSADGATVNRIAKWNGAAWTPLSTGVTNTLRALTVFDDGLGGGPALYAGGVFTHAGGVTVNRIGRWNGSAWSALGTGIGNEVRALAVYDDGSGEGEALYAGGQFGVAGGIGVNNIARWNGSAWSHLGAGTSSGWVYALAVFDDGSGDGPALYVGGVFANAGGVPVNNIARWNGTSWSALGSGTNGAVNALAVFDDGSGGGPALYAGGLFTTAGGVTVNRIAKWDGRSWSALGTGMSGGVHALTVFDADLGSGPSLIAGGEFVVSPAGDSFLARWGCADPEPCAPADFNCDGVVDGTDLVVVLGAWGTCGAPPCAADLNDDGVIDGNDLVIVLGAWSP